LIAKRIRIRVTDDALGWWGMNEITVERVPGDDEFDPTTEYILDFKTEVMIKREEDPLEEPDEEDELEEGFDYCDICGDLHPSVSLRLHDGLSFCKACNKNAGYEEEP